MTNFTPIPNSALITADSINDPLQELSDKIDDVIGGGSAIENLNLGTGTALEIAGGAITRTRSQHTVDTEASATADDLTTISGGVTGDELIISVVSASRVVTVKHGTGNIDTFSKVDIELNDTALSLRFIYRNARWEQQNGLPTKAAGYNSYRLPTGLPIRVHTGTRQMWGVRAAAATLQGINIVTPTITGTTTASASNDTDSTYVNLVSGNVATNSSGFALATYNYVRMSHNPIFRCVFRTGAASDLLNIRIYVGLCSAVLTTVDTIAGATEAAAIRYSTVAADAGWTPVTKDATTQNLGSSMLAIAASTRYLFEIELDSVNSRAIFKINNGTPVILSSNLPASSTELGVNFLLYTTAAAVKNWKFSRLEVEHD